MIGPASDENKASLLKIIKYKYKHEQNYKYKCIYWVFGQSLCGANANIELFTKITEPSCRSKSNAHVTKQIQTTTNTITRRTDHSCPRNQILKFDFGQQHLNLKCTLSFKVCNTLCIVFSIIIL